MVISMSNRGDNSTGIASLEPRRLLDPYDDNSERLADKAVAKPLIIPRAGQLNDDQLGYRAQPNPDREGWATER